ncbi:protein SMG5 [Ostrinia furnacalis]|uniref:protein SMG5 n=1 Tax=Ostrinia furnacalis TaxID=93504 RepID=UPI00103C8B0D|nr:protein SMG5 [Ostrinia furnacalis]
MKNGCNDLSEAKVAERNEKAKKLYRYVTDVARRISERTSTCRSIPDLFSTSTEVQRQKLRDNCEKLLFLDPVEYGKKCLELLWRKVYYDTVCTAKKLREVDNENDSYLFTHIICGIGHFHHFIARIQSEFKVDFKDLDYTMLPQDEEGDEINTTPTEELLQFGRSALHSCLIYLGDLSRYQVEIFQSLDPSIAARYYLQAAHVDLCSGMPYNQLGNLYMDKNYNLDSVCYYIQCLSTEAPFEGAMGNLTKIFEKNNQFTETINISEFPSQGEHVQNTISNFLSLIEIWYLGKDDTNIPQRCNTIAQQLKVCMDFTKAPLPDINKNYMEYTQAIEEEGVNPTYLNANLVHKMVQICLFTMSRMMETDEVKAFACKAFTLALLSQLLQKLLKQIELLGLKNPASKYRARRMLVQETESVEDEVESVQENPIVEDTIEINGNNDSCEELHFKEVPSDGDGDPEKLQNGDAKNGRKSLKRRRRRRLASSESSDVSNADTESSEVETDESCSDEELSDSTYPSEDESKSDASDTEASDVEEVNKQNGDIEESAKEPVGINGKHPPKSFGDKRDSKDKPAELNELGIQNFLLGDNYLASIKLLQDWLYAEKDLIMSCGDSGESLFQCVVDLLNILTFYFNPKSNYINENKSKILNYAKYTARNLKLEYKSIPLSEDVNLRGTSICKFDKHAAEWQTLDRYKPSQYEENIIRIMNFIDFGNHIAKIVPRIRFNRSMKIFYFKKLHPPKVNTKVSHKKVREWHNTKKNNEAAPGGLLRRLGRLWLTAQVRELERRAPAAPSLLALDAAALAHHLRRVKQLWRARSFVLLVPAVVLQELDEMKRTDSGARDAIRWLELQLRSGSRFVRAQRPGQARPLPLLRLPRKAPPSAHNFVQILEFCNHFVGDERGREGEGDADALVLLVGEAPAAADPGPAGADSGPAAADFSPAGAAAAAGVPLERVADFYARWRHAAPKNGKKR